MVAEAPGGGDDGDIINRTRQNRNEQGCTQFATTLPSGRTVTSEWLNPDMLKKALLPWIESIKGQLAADREEYETSRRRAALAIREKQGAAAGGAIITPSSGVALDPTATAAPVPKDRLEPHAFARDALDDARKNVAYWRVQAETATRSLAKATKDLENWQTIVHTLTVKEQLDNG